MTDKVAQQHPPLRAMADEIVPMFRLDQQLSHFILSKCFLFFDVLDVNKLHIALARLVECGQWRKLGGRIRRTVRPELISWAMTDPCSLSDDS